MKIKDWEPAGKDYGKRGPRGYDAGKRVSGRKGHIIVDTIGLFLAVVIHAANIQDRDGARLVLAKLLGRFPRLQIIWADAVYAGRPVAWAWAAADLEPLRLLLYKDPHVRGLGYSQYVDEGEE